MNIEKAELLSKWLGGKGILAKVLPARLRGDLFDYCYYRFIKGDK